MSKNEQYATAQALLAFVNLHKSEEQRFMTTLNLLLRASPKQRRQIVDELREEASRGRVGNSEQLP